MEAGYCPRLQITSRPPILTFRDVASNRADCIKSNHASQPLKVRASFHNSFEKNLRLSFINPSIVNQSLLERDKRFLSIYKCKMFISPLLGHFGICSISLTTSLIEGTLKLSFITVMYLSNCLLFYNSTSSITNSILGLSLSTNLRAWISTHWRSFFMALHPCRQSSKILKALSRSGRKFS